jgi:hypothetical protein
MPNGSRSPSTWRRRKLREATMFEREALLKVTRMGEARYRVIELAETRIEKIGLERHLTPVLLLQAAIASASYYGVGDGLAHLMELAQKQGGITL